MTPWFVTGKTPDGAWDFTRIDPARCAEAFDRDLCWVTGAPLGFQRYFIGGAFMVADKVTNEPPSSMAGVTRALSQCPFLTDPDATRRAAMTSPQRGTFKRTGTIAVGAVLAGDYDFRDGVFVIHRLRGIAWSRAGRPATPDEIAAAKAMAA